MNPPRGGAPPPRPAAWAGRYLRKPPHVRPYSPIPFSFKIRQTFSGVMGMSMCLTPRCARASTTALAMAGGAPTVADSPTPFGA